MSGQIKIQEHKMQMRPARCVALVMAGIVAVVRIEQPCIMWENLNIEIELIRDKKRVFECWVAARTRQQNSGWDCLKYECVASYRHRPTLIQAKIFILVVIFTLAGIM